jgi:hypothetical protein
VGFINIFDLAVYFLLALPPSLCLSCRPRAADHNDDRQGMQRRRVPPLPMHASRASPRLATASGARRAMTAAARAARQERGCRRRPANTACTCHAMPVLLVPDRPRRSGRREVKDAIRRRVPHRCWDDESPTGAQTHHRRHLQQVRVCRQCATLAGVNMLTDEQAFQCRWQPFCW